MCAKLAVLNYGQGIDRRYVRIRAFFGRTYVYNYAKLRWNSLK